MWQKFLKKNQGPFLVPPTFRHVKVTTPTKQNFEIEIKCRLKDWSYVDGEGKTGVLRKALYSDVAAEIERYPSVLTAFLEKKDGIWLVVTAAGPAVLRLPPDTTLEPDPMTRIRATLMGTVLLFKQFDVRDTSPWKVDEALMMLKAEALPTDPPKGLSPEQQIAFHFLLEKEKVNRVPLPEQNIKGILAREGASLISLKESRNGYSIAFNYKGSRRNIRVKEDLMLMDSGMCLSGRDRDFSLDSFLSILHNRGRRGWRDDHYD